MLQRSEAGYGQPLSIAHNCVALRQNSASGIQPQAWDFDSANPIHHRRAWLLHGDVSSSGRALGNSRFNSVDERDDVSRRAMVRPRRTQHTASSCASGFVTERLDGNGWLPTRRRRVRPIAIPLVRRRVIDPLDHPVERTSPLSSRQNAKCRFQSSLCAGKSVRR